MKPFHKHARLGREGDRLPWQGRMFGQGTDVAGYEIVDDRDSLTAGLIRDGSIVLEEPKALEPEPGPAPRAEAPAPVVEHEAEHAPELAAHSDR